MDDRNGGFPRLSDVVAHALRCPASPRRTLKADNLGKPSLWVFIIAPSWYQVAELGHDVFVEAAFEGDDEFG